MFMGKITIIFENSLRNRIISKKGIELLVTDAPKAVLGRGEFFSPTDLLAISVGSCMLTLMGCKAREAQVDLTGTYIHLKKEMHVTPIRRLKSIDIEFFCPRNFSEELTRQLIQAAEGCPVMYSLHPDIQKRLTYHWGIN